MRDYVLPRNRHTTRADKETILRVHLLPAFGDLRLDGIKAAAIDAFVSRKALSGLSPKTVNNILTVLHCALATAERWGLVRAVPRFRWLRVPPPPIKYFDPGQASRLLEAAPEGHWRTFVLFLLHTGARFGEAAGLRWQDVDLESGTIHIRQAAARGVVDRPKTDGSVRDLVVAAELVEELRALPRGHERVFPRLDGGVMHPASACKYIYAMCERAGIPRQGWHTLRHSFATTLVSRDVPLPVIQKCLGHRSIMMTARYAHASPEALRRAADVMQSAVPVPKQLGHLMVTNTVIPSTAASAR